MYVMRTDADETVVLLEMDRDAYNALKQSRHHARFRHVGAHEARSHVRDGGKHKTAIVIRDGKGQRRATGKNTPEQDAP